MQHPLIGMNRNGNAYKLEFQNQRHMKVLVKFFAHYRDIVGKHEERFEAPPGAKIRDLVKEIAGKYPRLGTLTESIFILSQQVVDSNAKLEDGDTLAIFPLVGGG